MDNKTLLAENERLRSLLKTAALTMGGAHRSMMDQCASNPIKNAWGEQVNVLSLNELQNVANRIAKELGDFDLTSAVYGDMSLFKQLDDFEAFFSKHGHPRPDPNNLVLMKAWMAEKSWSLKVWKGVGEAKDAVIQSLTHQLAMAEDAALKGDSARMMAGGMEMTIGEMSVEIAKRDVLLFDAISQLSSLADAKSSVSPRLAEAYREKLEEVNKSLAGVSQCWDGQPGPEHYNLLPPIGKRVSIYLSSNKAWVDHVVSGYYVWGNHGDDKNVNRVFVTVRDSEGYPNARLLKDVRRAGFVGPERADDE
jgi:hypothetical protein